MLTIDSKVSLGAFRAGEQLGTSYDQILGLPIDNFPTSIVELTACLDEAVAQACIPRICPVPGNVYGTCVARSFDSASVKRETSRQEAARIKVERLTLAQEIRRQQQDEIRSHKMALRVAATKEREKRKERETELRRCRSEAYKAAVARDEARKEHEHSLAQAGGSPRRA